MYISPLSKAIYLCCASLLLTTTVTHAETAFSTESLWMFGDWNGKRTQLQQQGYDLNFGYTGELSEIMPRLDDHCKVHPEIVGNPVGVAVGICQI